MVTCHEARITINPFLCTLDKKKKKKRMTFLLTPEEFFSLYFHLCDTCHFLGYIRGVCVHVSPERLQPH